MRHLPEMAQYTQVTCKMYELKSTASITYKDKRMGLPQSHGISVLDASSRKVGHMKQWKLLSGGKRAGTGTIQMGLKAGCCGAAELRVMFELNSLII